MGLTWHGAARELFEGCQPLLVISARRFTQAGATQLEDIGATGAAAHGPYRGIVWRVRGSLDPGLSRLKPLLLPGAALLLVVEARRPEALLRSLLGKPAWPTYALEDVCEALLLKGLSEPQLVTESKAGSDSAQHARCFFRATSRLTQPIGLP
jgi:hypothetical protein